MTKKYLSFFAPFLVLLAFLLDGQLSTLFTNLAPAGVTISSYLVLIVAIFLSMYLNVGFSLLLYFLIGMCYDLYYLGIIGLGTTLYPLVVYLIYYFYQNLSFKRVTNLIILMVILFGFDVLSFLFARLFHLTNLSLFIFSFYDLVPTLVYNLLLLLLLSPLLERLFGITNKT